METTYSKKNVDLPNGESYAYIDIGDHSKPSLVLIHGNMTSCVFFDLLFSRLKNEFRLVAPDLRGFGHSTFQNPFNSLDELADDIDLFTDALGLKTFSLLGWSLGGGVSMKFAAKYPKKVTHLILHNSLGLKGFSFHKLGPDFKFTEERCKTLEDVEKHPFTIIGLKRNAEKNLKQTMNVMQAVWTGPGVPSESRAKFFAEEAMLQRCVAEALHALNTYNISDESNGIKDGTGEYKNIKCKILGFAGKKDIVLSYFMAKEMKAKFGEQINLISYEKGGHSAMEDYPDDVSQKILEFVKKNVHNEARSKL